MNEALLLISTYAVSAFLILLGFYRYRKRGIFLDPLNMFLFQTCLFFMFQVPFIFFPGNLYMVGADYTQLWPEIWFCFGVETTYLMVTVALILLLFSSAAKKDLEPLVTRILRVTSFLFAGHRLYLLFFIPVAAILLVFVAKYGAALFLVSEMGTAAARTVVLRDAASFRFLFNFANSILSLLILYSLALTLDQLIHRRYLRLFLCTLVFLVFSVSGFLITGTRSFVLGPIIALGTSCIMFVPKYNRPRNILALGLALILMASALDFFREKSVQLALFKIFVSGNTFADFRDFVWAYNSFKASSMDFFMGRTYLSSWISFLPASVIPFREEWAWGRAILRVVGWSSDDHFGIRSGIAGFPYFNGGYPLVMVCAFLRGFILFLSQKIFDRLYVAKATLFTKLIYLIISSTVLEMIFFITNGVSLWGTYATFLIMITAFLASPLLRFSTRTSNKKGREALYP